MKSCARIVNAKNEYKSAITPWWVGFYGKLFHFYPFKYWSHQQFFWILYHYCNKKTLFNRNDVVFEMDFSSFSLAWGFFDTKSLPNSLKLSSVNSLPVHLFAIRGWRKWQFLKLLRGRGCTLGLPEINKTRSQIVCSAT